MAHDEVNSLHTQDIPEFPGALAEDVADLLHATTKRLRHAARHQMHDSRVTPGQWRALRVIAGCGESLRMSDIADRLHIARRSATDVIDELQDHGLVVRAADPDDRRSVVVTVTPEGHTFLAAAGAARRRVTARQLHALSHDELRQLARLLRRVLD